MSHYQNTKADFWASLDAGKNFIVCPCCGTHMSLQKPSSYRLMLTREASTHLNQQLTFYRLTIEAIERIMKRHNSDAYVNSVGTSLFPINTAFLTAEGTIKTKEGIYARNLLIALDIAKIDKAVQKLPKLDAPATDPPNGFTSQDLLALLLMPNLAAGLNIVVFDQPSTDATLTANEPLKLLEVAKNYDTAKDHSDPVIKHIMQKFPHFLQYCGRLAKETSSDKATPPDPNLIRAMALLIVYFGDGATKSDDANPSARVPQFVFGTYAQVRNWSTLGELLTSSYYVSALQGLFPAFTEHIHGLNKNSTVQTDKAIEELKLGGFDNFTKFTEWKENIPKLEEVVLYTVDFACAGPPATIPKNAQMSMRQGNKKVETTIEKEIAGTVESVSCGWIPKNVCTESLLLVGGTASGKTTLLQSALVQVKRAAGKLDMIFNTTSTLSDRLMQYYEQRYDNHDWEGATESGARTSMQISLTPSADRNNTSYLVLNDIAGEHFEEMLMGGKDRNEILSPLGHAQHIIFLFDFVAWTQLNALFEDVNEEAEKAAWADLKTQTENQKSVGRAMVDSRDLIVKLVAMLANASGSGNERIDRSFMLVIPKCDMYLQEGKFLNGWVVQCVGDNYLKNVGTDDAPLYRSTWIFDGKKDAPKGVIEKLGDKEDVTDKFDVALQGIGKMSASASVAIKDLAKQMAGQTETSVSAEYLAVSISSLLTYLENTFSDVKVVPVSALGMSPKQTKETAAEGYNLKAVPLFCEALLLLPMLKMKTSKTPRKDANQEDSLENEDGSIKQEAFEQETSS